MCARSPIRKPLRRREAGLSLVELVIAIVVISVGVAGVLAAFNESVRGSAQPFVAKQALAIAEALLEEVQLAGFTFCRSTDPKYAADPSFQAASAADCTAGFAEASGPEAGDARPFDNVNDYDGFALAAISDVAAVAVPGAAGYSAAVTVLPMALNTVAAAESLLITVTVTAPNGEIYALQGYRTRHSPNAMP